MNLKVTLLFFLAIAPAFGAKPPALDIKATRAMADQGNPDAQTLLGQAYHEGWGLRKDFAEAAKWFRKAAEQGSPKAQGQLGLLYQTGEGVPQDFSLSVKWYRAGAEQGDVDAQWHLGVMYNTGRGVPQDFVQAHMWVNVAASRATGAQQFVLSSVRAEIAKQMSAEQIATAQELAREWKPKNIEVGR